MHEGNCVRLFGEANWGEYKVLQMRVPRDGQVASDTRQWAVHYRAQGEASPYDEGELWREGIVAITQTHKICTPGTWAGSCGTTT